MTNIKNSIAGLLTMIVSLVTAIGILMIGSGLVPNTIQTFTNGLQPGVVTVIIIALAMGALSVTIKMASKTGRVIGTPKVRSLVGSEVAGAGAVVGVMVFALVIVTQSVFGSVFVDTDASLLSTAIVGVPLFVQSVKKYTPDMSLIERGEDESEYDVEYIRDKTSKLDSSQPNYQSSNSSSGVDEGSGVSHNAPSDEELASREPESVNGDGVQSGDVDLSSLTYAWRKETEVSFEDIGGMEELKNELNRDVIKPLTTHKEKAESLGISAPNIVFHGPPGTGKTYMAKALATELGLPFAKLSGADIQSKWINESADKVKQLFDEAEMVAGDAGGAVVFLDELDSVLKNRSGGGGHEEDNKVVNEFLNHLEDTGENDVVFIGATNRLDSLDEAGIRSGRIDKKVHIGKPDFEARREIITKQLKNRPHDLSEEVIIDVTSDTEGCVAADLELVVKTAAKHVLGRDGETITEKDMKTAVGEVGCEN